MNEENIKIVVVGHVDHGKSTFIGRLLYDTDSLTKTAIDKVQNYCKEKNMNFEYAFILDSLQEEQEQNITIDIRQIQFSTKKRNYTIIDAPGHKEFLKNMISGASNAEAAILMIDASEGVKEQSRKHAYLLSLIGIQQILVLVNKMDAVNFEEKRFNELKKEMKDYLIKLGIIDAVFIPVSAKNGDNLIKKSEKMRWYKGQIVIESIDALKKEKDSSEMPLRLPIQDIYKFDDRRIIVGRIESGKLCIGEEIILLPSNKKSKIANIESWPKNKQIKQHSAYSGQCVGITLADEYFFKRGEVISTEQKKPQVSNLFSAKIFWMGKKDLESGKKYLFKFNTQEIDCEVHSITKIIDSETLENSQKSKVSRNEVAEVVIKSETSVVFDLFKDIQSTGRFVIIDDLLVAGGGIIHNSGERIKSSNVFWQEGKVSREDRCKIFGSKNKVIWFTGLSSSGKSTISIALEKELNKRRFPSYILDGDNIRHGLNGNLGFSKEDRKENIRRIAEVSKLFYDAGIFTIVCFISPYKEDREFARKLIGRDFIEVFLDCSVEECEKRDTKGLYKKAKAGLIKNFTGINDPYEKPESPEITLNTVKMNVEECVDSILSFLRELEKIK